MNNVFGKIYADIYDSIYQEKNYDEECQIIKTIFNSYGEKTISSILDLGCGTGNHAIRLALQGYSLTGIDRSNDMLKIAENKAKNNGVHINLYNADIKTYSLNKKFDAVIMMFAVLGYQTDNDDVLQTLQKIGEHLETGSLLIFDVWYGPAVLSQKPGERVSIIDRGDKKIIRLSFGSLDTFHHICTVNYRVFTIFNKQLADETSECHQMRYFFPQEIAFFLNCSGFKMEYMGPFPHYEGELNDNTWNALVVGKKI